MVMKALILEIAVYGLAASSLLSLVRVVIGPTVEDRMIGFNLVSAQVLAILILIAVQKSQTIYLDVALVYAILGYIGILAIAKYIRSREEE
jgi:multicomponent Na+:H+ antiporter subunit F